MENWKLKAGKFLFKWRSFTQLPWIIFTLIFLKPYHPSFSLHLEPFLTIAGMMITLCGEILRVWAHLYASEGTSGRETFLRADSLNREGPYRFVRNPLYLGNFHIIGGLLIVFSNIIAFLIGIVFLIFQYYFIVLAEENYLEGKFGEEWLNYKKNVPKFFPKIKNLKNTGTERKNTLAKVIFREMDTIFNILTMLFLIILIKINHLKGLSIKEITHAFLLYSPLFLIYVFLKILKK